MKPTKKELSLQKGTPTMQHIAYRIITMGLENRSPKKKHESKQETGPH